MGKNRNLQEKIGMILSIAFVGSIVLGTLAGIFNWEILGIICCIVFTIVLIAVFVPAIISLFKK